MHNRNISLAKIINSSSNLSNNHFSSLEQLKIDIKGKLNIFSSNIKILKKRISSIHDIFTDSGDSENKEIIKIFKETIGSSIDELEKYLQEQEKANEEIYLLEASFIEHIIRIIAAIIEFQKRLDTLYPDLSKKIIDYLSDFLVGLIATQMPIVALAIKGSGILDIIKSYITIENLTELLNNWNKKLVKVQTNLNEIKEHKILKKQFSLAKQVLEISEITGISVVPIAELGLDKLEQIKEALLKNPKSLDSFKEIIELSKAVPHSKDTITKTLTKLGAEITKISNSVLSEDTGLKKFVEKELSSAKENLVTASIPNKNIMEKLEYCHKAAKNIFNIYNKITETAKSTPNGEKIIETIGKLMKDQTKNVIPSSFLNNLSSLMPKLEPLSKIIKIENVLKIAFENGNKIGRSI